MKLSRKPEVKSIITDVAELSYNCDEIDSKSQQNEQADIVADLKATMKDKGLRSLSAPAIGYKKRIFCIDDGVEIKTFINPMPWTDKDNPPTMQVTKEICSSIPGKTFLRFRQDKIGLYYTRPNGQFSNKEFHGWLAVLIQHELEHLDGILLSDFGLELDEDWDSLTDDEKAQVLMWYKSSLDVEAEKMHEEVMSDPQAKELVDGIEFMTKVAIGEVELANLADLNPPEEPTTEAPTEEPKLKKRTRNKSEKSE